MRLDRLKEYYWHLCQQFWAFGQNEWISGKMWLARVDSKISGKIESPVTIRRIEPVVKDISIKKISDPNGITGKFQQVLDHPIFFQILPDNGKNNETSQLILWDQYSIT